MTRRLVDDRTALRPYLGAPLAQEGAAGAAVGPGNARPERRRGGHETGRPAHRAHVVVPRRAHVGRSLGDERDGAVEEHGATGRLQPAVGPQDLRRDRGTGSDGRQRGRGLDRAGERQHARFDDDDDVVIRDRPARPAASISAIRRSAPAAAARAPRWARQLSSPSPALDHTSTRRLATTGPPEPPSAVRSRPFGSRCRMNPPPR